MIYPQQPGTYCFHNTVNNKVYVGSAQCLYTRINNHHLKGKNSNQLLQRAIKKYGITSFNITYVITETHAEAKIQEQLMLDYLFHNNTPKYNISAYAYGGDGSSSKIRYALEVNNFNNIYTFKSSIEAEKTTGVSTRHISGGCKYIKPYNSKFGRWLFSDISIDDLKAKFNNLTKAEIKGINRYSKGFILINKITKEQSRIFYSIYSPQNQGLNVNKSNLNQCLLGNIRTVNGYYVALCI